MATKLDFVHLAISASKVMLMATGTFLHVAFRKRHSKNPTITIFNALIFCTSPKTRNHR